MSRTKRIALATLAVLLAAGGVTAAAGAPEAGSVQAHEFVCC